MASYTELQQFLHLGWVLGILILWTLPWKAVALWRAARNNDKIWFAVLLLANTLAVLEIIYIFAFSKRKK